MAHAMWTGTISFGLVSIPVRLMAATSRKGVSFNLLHKECNSRIQEKRWCPQCDKEITWADVEKGYQYAKDEYVSFAPEDFESLPLPSKNILEVESFVEIDEIDPIYFDSSYFLQPDKKGNNSYNLLRTALEKKKMVAVGKIALRTKERLCIVRVYGSHLLVETLLYPDEINLQDEESITDSTPSKQELSIAEHLVDLMTKPFEPDQYKDNYREALEELVEAKVSGGTIKAPSKKSTGKVLDLMEALRESVLTAQKGGTRRSSRKAAAEDLEEVEVAPVKKTIARAKKSAATTRRIATTAKKTTARAKEPAVKKKVTPIQRKRKKAS